MNFIFGRDRGELKSQSAPSPKMFLNSILTNCRSKVSDLYEVLPLFNAIRTFNVSFDNIMPLE